MLRTLLAHADQDPQTANLAQNGGRAFVSLSLRPFLLAAILDQLKNQAASTNGQDVQLRALERESSYPPFFNSASTSLATSFSVSNTPNP